MDRAAIRESMTGVFRDVFESDALTLRDDMSAQDIPDWDSFTHVILITELEKVFNLRFTAAEVQDAANVGAFVDLVHRKLSAG